MAEKKLDSAAVAAPGETLCYAEDYECIWTDPDTDIVYARAEVRIYFTATTLRCARRAHARRTARSLLNGARADDYILIGSRRTLPESLRLNCRFIRGSRRAL